ncbi:hypothetical protein P9112_002308 [Eukaryota sp. TZLM1-RC]
MSDPNVVASDGDVKNSTFVQTFSDDPATSSRFFEGRIAEQNIISFAVGMALQSKVPFVSSFGKFFSRTYDQLEMGIISEANIKIVSSHVGLGPCSDGPSQMALSDVAYLSSLTVAKRHSDGRPAMRVIYPCDGPSCFKLTCLMKETNGPCCLRVLRQDTPLIYSEDAEFSLEKGFNVIKISPDASLLLIASGFMVSQAVLVADKLKDQGLEAAILDIYSLPISTSEFVSTIQQSKVSRILTIEDNYGSSMGSVVCSVVAQLLDGIRVKQLFVNRVPKSARKVEEILQYCQLDVESIVQSVWGFV